MGLQKEKRWRYNHIDVFLLGLLSYPQALAALPWICPILSHQKVDLASHFHVVDPSAGFIALPLSSAARLLIVPASLDLLDEPIHGEDSV